ncbi:MAG: demethoxyubiquinone hydroxylase family protein [Acetobacteraceae bacterium]
MNDATFIEPPPVTGAGRLPGDPTPEDLVHRMIRVDHAGEYGASRIYAGQLAVLGHTDTRPLLEHMAEQERVHLETFSRMIADRGVRPTAMLPLWHVAGYVLGAGTALLGSRAAMACTVAVEEAIDEHYRDQAAALGEDERPLRETIERFRAEELEHRDIGLEHEAELAPAYRLLSAVIKAGCRIAIRISERV